MEEAPTIDASVAICPQPDRPGASPPEPGSTWFSIDTDVSLGGEPTGEWLVVSSAGVAVAGRTVARGERPPAAAIRQVPWPEIERIRTAAGVGGGMLQVRVGGDWVDLVRYSNRLASRFHKVARALETARDEAATSGSAVTEPVIEAGPLDPPHCPSCSLRLATPETSPFAAAPPIVSARRRIVESGVRSSCERLSTNSVRI